MGLKQLYNDNLRKLPNEYGDVSVMITPEIRRKIHRKNKTHAKAKRQAAANLPSYECFHCS